MEENRKMYVTAEETAEILGVSTGYAYKIIQGLNEELKRKRVPDNLRQSSNKVF